MFAFFVALAGIAAKYLQAAHNSTANAVGVGIDLVDAATLEVLKENARIKGATVDWSDPAAVKDFLATLPVFTPIPEPPKS